MFTSEKRSKAPRTFHFRKRHSVGSVQNRSFAKFSSPPQSKNNKSFLGVTGFYRKCIPNYSEIALPLTQLLKKDAKFNWTSTQQKAFETLKEMLLTRLCLQFPDFNKPFNLTTDASGFAIAACLSQGEGDDDRPLAFASGTLNKAERNYSSVEREALAVINWVKYFNHYLYNYKVRILTDCRAPKWLFSINDPSSRLLRWRLSLETYYYKIHYRTGRSNVVADALSRNPDLDPKHNFELLKETQNHELEEAQIFPNALEDPSKAILQNHFFSNHPKSNPSILSIQTNPPQTQESYEQFLQDIQKNIILNHLVTETNCNFKDNKDAKILIASTDLDFPNIDLPLPEQLQILQTRTFSPGDILRPPETAPIYILFLKAYHWEMIAYKVLFDSFQKLKVQLLEDKIVSTSLDELSFKTLKWGKSLHNS